MHGEWDAVTKRPFYDASSSHIWAMGSVPDMWGMYMRDLVWMYARAINAMVRDGRDPHDGELLRDELLATDFQGLTGRIKLSKSTQDRAVALALYNLQNGPGGLLRVRVGYTPIKGQLTLDAGASVRWPGGEDNAPVDGIEDRDITSAVMLSFTDGGTPSLYAQKLFCAAQLAAMHVSNLDGSIIPQLATLPAKPILRYRLLPFDTLGSQQGGVQAWMAASRAGCLGLIGPGRSSVSVPIATISNGMPQLSPTATATILSSKEKYPGYGRTHPNDDQVSAALVTTLRTNFWAWRKFGVLHVNDEYGHSFLHGLRKAFDQLRTDTESANGQMRLGVVESYEPGDQATFERAARALSMANSQILICIAHRSDMPALLEVADHQGLLTQEYAWILIDLAAVLDPALTDVTFASRLHGMLTFAYSPSETTGFVRLERAWRGMTIDDCRNDLFIPQDAFFEEKPPDQAALIFDAVALMGYTMANISKTVDGGGSDPYQSRHMTQLMKGLSVNGSSGFFSMTESLDRACPSLPSNHCQLPCSLFCVVARGSTTLAHYISAPAGSSVGATYTLRNFVHVSASGDPQHDIKLRNVLVFKDGDEANIIDPRGQESCRCLSAFVVAPRRHPNGSLIATIDGNEYSYPPEYGLHGCGSHDMGTAPSCNGASPAAWCQKKWCYVDHDSCQGDTSLSYYYEVSIHYSYATCTSQKLLGAITWKGGLSKIPIDTGALGCPPGEAWSADANDGTDCSACGKGKFKAIRSFLPCLDCAPGEYQSEEGQKTCTACEPGKYQDGSGRESCRSCLLSETSRSGSTFCICRPGQFRPTPGGTCTDCPQHAECSGAGVNGTTLETLELPTGTYRLSGRTQDVHKCYGHSRGKGFFQACVGGFTAEDVVSSRRGLESSAYAANTSALPRAGYCAAGHSGPLCQVCVDDTHYYFDKYSGQCKYCGSALRAGGVILAAVAAACIGCFALPCLQSHVGCWPDRQKWYQYALRWLSSRAARIGLLVKIKLLIGFYQVLNAASSVFRVMMPAEYDHVSFGIRWLSFDLWGFMLPVECVGSHAASLGLQMCWPFALIGLTVVIWRMHALCLRSEQKAASIASLRQHLPTFSLLVLFCLVPSMSSRLLGAFRCTTFGFDDRVGGSGAAISRRFLMDDLRIVCPDDTGGEPKALYQTFHQVRAIAIVGVVLWPVGVPLFFLYLALRGRFQHKRHNVASFLMDDYRKQCFFWEPVEMVRKLAITGYILAVPEENSFLRLLLATVLSMGFLVAHLLVTPFRMQADNACATVVHTTTACVLISLIGVKMCDDLDDVACKALGVTPFAFSVTILVISLVLLVVVTCVVMHSMRQRLGVVCFHQTHHAVQLSIRKGYRFHVFISQ